MRRCQSSRPSPAACPSNSLTRLGPSKRFSRRTLLTTDHLSGLDKFQGLIYCTATSRRLLLNMRDAESGRPLYAGLERQLVRANPTSRACARRSRLHSRPTFLALIPFSMHWPRTRRTRSSSRPARCPSPCCQPTTASAQSCASRPPKMTRLARATGLTLGAAGMPCQVSGDGRQRDDPAHRYAAAQTPKPSVQSLNRPLLAAVPHRRLSHGACGLERGAGGSVLAVPWARRPAATNRPRGLGHVVLRRQVAPISYARTCVSRGAFAAPASGN